MIEKAKTRCNQQRVFCVIRKWIPVREPLEFIHYREDAVADFFDCTYSVNLVIFSSLVIVLDERLSLVVICNDAVVDCVFASVVCTALLECASLDALHDHLVWDHD